jgi:hypothetical protein
VAAEELDAGDETEPRRHDALFLLDAGVASDPVVTSRFLLPCAPLTTKSADPRGLNSLTLK